MADIWDISIFLGEGFLWNPTNGDDLFRIQDFFDPFDKLQSCRHFAGVRLSVARRLALLMGMERKDVPKSWNLQGSRDKTPHFTCCVLLRSPMERESWSEFLKKSGFTGHYYLFAGKGDSCNRAPPVSRCFPYEEVFAGTECAECFKVFFNVPTQRRIFVWIMDFICRSKLRELVQQFGNP